MELRELVEEDFVNYKKPSMFITTPYCDFKCCKEAGVDICQNMSIVHQPIHEINDEDLINRYLSNPITKAIVFGGLEPINSFNDLLPFVRKFREISQDDIVIYTGYTIEEIANEVTDLMNYPNIIIKFGRFIPGQQKHFDEVLGVELASDNQHAIKIS